MKNSTAFRLAIAIAISVSSACVNDREHREDPAPTPVHAQTPRTESPAPPARSTSTPSVAPATPPTPPKLASDLTTEDREFLQNAYRGGVFEIEASRIAVEKNIPDEQREFARKMIEDHGKSNDDIRALADKKSVPLPTTLESDERQQVEELRDLNGKEFESAFHDMQARAHESAIESFEKAVRDTKDADIKALASSTLPTLREHRKMLEPPRPIKD